MKAPPQEFALIFETVEEYIENGDFRFEAGAMTQAVAMQDTFGEIYSFVNNAADPDDEIRFVSETSMRGHVDRMVCMWANGEIDVPSWRLIGALIAKDNNNKSAKVLLNGGNKYTVRELRELLPKKFNKS